MLTPDSREEFALNEGETYLDHGGFGVTPRDVARARARAHERIEANPRAFFEVDFRPAWSDYAGRVAKRFSSRPEDLALVGNATDGINAVLRSISFRSDDEILISSWTYGAVANAAAHISRPFGARVVPMQFPYPRCDPAQYVDALSAAIGPRTKLAIVDHVSSATGLVAPIAEMVAACRRREVAALVDGAHAPGSTPIDLEAIDADYYVADLHKWYFVPRGCGFLWARRDRQEKLTPSVLSWDIEREFPLRFQWVGTTDPTAWLSIPAAFAFMDRFGEENVRRHNRALVTEGARLLADAWGVGLDAPGSMIGAMIAAPLPDGLPFPATEAGRCEAQRLLWGEHNIIVPCVLLEGRLHLRLSAQIYNDIADFEKLARAVRRMIA